jgi:hypothetical protein
MWNFSIFKKNSTFILVQDMEQDYKGLLIEYRNVCKRSPTWKPVMKMDKAHKYFLCKYQTKPLTIYCAVSKDKYQNIIQKGFGELEDFPQFFPSPLFEKKTHDIILVCSSAIMSVKSTDIVIVGRFNEITKSTAFKKTITDAQKIMKNKELYSFTLSKDVMNTNKQNAILAYHGTYKWRFNQIMKNNYFGREMYSYPENSLEGTYFSVHPSTSYTFAKVLPKKYSDSLQTSDIIVNIVIVSKPSPWDGKWKDKMATYKRNGKYRYDISIGEDEIRTYDNKKTYIIGTISDINT